MNAEKKANLTVSDSASVEINRARRRMVVFCTARVAPFGGKKFDVVLERPRIQHPNSRIENETRPGRVDGSTFARQAGDDSTQKLMFIRGSDDFLL